MRPYRNKLDIENAKKSAREYCMSNGLDLSVLSKQSIYAINNKVIFAQPSTKKTYGLKTDISSQPKPTLVAEKKAHGFVVNSTEHTAKILGIAKQN